ncbi:MAG: iron-sulfur cluster repair di-iron protein, ric [Clostridiales bacterium]|jgi:iron-sulfur cluster repair protein YtfE (RIC family)|nr:iron-sulfur cluster repair di-iron protein, ric [Clostridiales bacterium]
MLKFDEVIKRNFEKLQLFVPIVARVHGENHPEFHDVHKLFDEISAKIKNAAPGKPDLDSELKQLREITNNYTVPDGVCESCEAVYSMLAEIDKAYQA